MDKTILIVDDDLSIISIFEFILQEAGFKTLTARSGKECIDIVGGDQSIDLIFLDVKMPHMSGISTYQELQKIDPSLLIIMMTGYSVDDLLKEAFELGAYGVIYKPFDMEEVLGIIDSIFTKLKESASSAN